MKEPTCDAFLLVIISGNALLAFGHCSFDVKSFFFFTMALKHCMRALRVARGHLQVNFQTFLDTTSVILSSPVSIGRDIAALLSQALSTDDCSFDSVPKSLSQLQRAVLVIMVRYLW